MTVDPSTPEAGGSLTARLRDAITTAAPSGTVSPEAAETAAVYLAAYCSRLTAADDLPLVVERVALAMAQRMTSNPLSQRDVSAEGQSMSYAPTGLLYIESLLVNPYRRRSA